MKQGEWRTILKLRIVAQLIAAIASALAAIYQLLKKYLRDKGVLLTQRPLVSFLLWHKRGQK